MRHAILVLVLGLGLAVACGATGSQPTRHDDAAPPAFAIPKTGPFTLPAEYTRCTTDADCTFVALGCCDTTAVLRSRGAEVLRLLERSGRPECPVKAACGPGAHGTWEGTPGRCVDRRCDGPRE